MNNIETLNQTPFESIKHTDENGQEYWYARELQHILEYAEWRNFTKVIAKAKESCSVAGNQIVNHFVDVNKIVYLGVAKREIQDIVLSRYACYLIAQNGDPQKVVIAQAQAYFAVKTHQQELEENFLQLSEDQKRLAIRNDLKTHNKSLVDAAKLAGIKNPADYAVFQNHGYKGLYGGLGAKDIHRRKHLKKSEKILDHMGSTELAANLFRATQTDEKIRREGIVGKGNANRTHFEVGKKVRQTIKELGGTMPEDLPTPVKSIRQIEKEQKQLDRKPTKKIK